MCSSISSEENREKVKETDNIPMKVLPKNNTSNLRSNARKIIKTYGNIISTQPDGNCGIHCMMGGLQQLGLKFSRNVGTFRNNVYDYIDKN